MFNPKSTQNMLKHRPLKNNNNDGCSSRDDSGGDSGRGKRQDIRPTKKIVADDLSVDSIYTTDDLQRNRSNETHSTANSTISGVYSIDLLKEIYPALSESGSEFGAREEDINELDTIVHNNMNHYNIFRKTLIKNEEERSSKDLSLSSLVYDKVLATTAVNRISSWKEDRPFDEESLRALSEKMSDHGDSIETLYAKNSYSWPVKEYVLPPVGNVNNFIQPATKSLQLSSNDTFNNSKTFTTGTVHVPAVYSNHDNLLPSIDQSGTRLEASSKRAIEDDKEVDIDVPRRNYCYVFGGCIFFILFLAVGVIVSFMISRNRDVKPDSLLIVASIDSNESSAQPSNVGNSIEHVPLPTKPPQESFPIPSPNPIDRPNYNPLSDTSTEHASVQITTDTPSITSLPEEQSTSWGNIANYEEPIPILFFPLGFCEGDCDRDADCDEGLICFQRGPNDLIPFCHGGEDDPTRTDYCTYADNSDGNISEGTEFQEVLAGCTSTITVTQDCFFSTENVIVVEFKNCKPSNRDWIGIYADGTSIEFGSTEWIRDDYIGWAFTCGEQDCADSPSIYSFAFSTNNSPAYDLSFLRAYLARSTADNGPPYEIIAKSLSFTPKKAC